MNAIRNLFVIAVVAASLAACGGTTYIGDFGDGPHLMFHDGVLTAHVRGQPDAAINAAGDLRIGGKPVATTPAQRDLLKAYYAQVANIRRAGIETGKAGAAMAAHAIGAVASGLAHGDPDSIESKIDERAKEVESKAQAICKNLGELQETQDAVAASLPAFRPYETIVVRDSSDCLPKSDHAART